MSAPYLDKLREPFPADAIEWRIGRAGERSGNVWAVALAYVTSRAIMDRLDDVVGPGNWCDEYREWHGDAQLCGISIRVEPDLWVCKWDGAPATDIEGVKGGLSDSMKRAAVKWGIGRYLYKLDESWVETSNVKRDGWNYQGKGSKTPAFWWQTPSLPAWALPVGAKSAPAPPMDLPQHERKQEKPDPSRAAAITFGNAALVLGVPKEFSAPWALKKAGKENYGDMTASDWKDAAGELSGLLDHWRQQQ